MVGQWGPNLPPSYGYADSDTGPPDSDSGAPDSDAGPPESDRNASGANAGRNPTSTRIN